MQIPRIISSLWKLAKPFLPIVLVLASIAAGIATYAAMAEMPPLGDDPNTLIWLLNLDFAILLLLVVLVAKRLVGLWSGRKRGLAGSHLHVRLVTTFSLLAAIPAIVMTVFSVFFFHYGVQSWFSERVQTAVTESKAVAQAYLREHQQVIRADVLAMANDLNRQYIMSLTNPEAFQRFVQTQSLLRNLSEVLLFNIEGEVIARSNLSFSLEFAQVPTYAIRRADDGDVVIVSDNQDDRVRALVKLSNFDNAYLFVGRMVDPQVLSHLADTEKASEDYANLQTRYASLQITVTMMFILVGMLMVFAAIWLGIILARQMVQPIGKLITATERVRGGDLSARLDNESSGLREFDLLGRAFNRMTEQIEEQQNQLIGANRQLDERRRFIETVLTGVTSGVLSLNSKFVVTAVNHSAAQLLGIDAEDMVDKKADKILPGIKVLLDEFKEGNKKLLQREIPFEDRDEHIKRFLVRISAEKSSDNSKNKSGAVITFDDITELQSAQRKAAWADVARRIAHEIKNPLTPIQLSAERIRRKYKNQIVTDQEIFLQCTETIIKHVEDIGYMVNEFSAFARMPEPKMSDINIADQIKQSMTLQQQAHTDIRFNFENNAKSKVLVNCDAAQIRQALTNLIQNAAESIHEASIDNGEISISLDKRDSDIFITVMDNGIGFPDSNEKADLTEPYITHKEKGTGLGLAIVKKIMEDHGGKLLLENNEGGGAKVSLIFLG